MAVAMTGSAYQHAVSRIEAVSWRGMRPGLERTEALLHVLGDPHRGMCGVLVAGTNGKGSVCALIDAMLRAADVRTVLLTKPHLVSYRERIVIDGVPVDEDTFSRLIDTVAGAASTLPEQLQPTGFELLTVAGIVAAADAHADMLVCEVGLGGRLDSTNVLDLGVAVVTGVGLDHQEHLGSTVTAIAREKAAIIKPGNAAVTGARSPALDVIRARCDAVGVGLTVVSPDDVRVTMRDTDGVDVVTTFAGDAISVHAPLIGAFQGINVAVALAVTDQLRLRFALPIHAASVRRGCDSVRWPGRMQWIAGSPPLLIDGAHNPDGMRALTQSLASLRGGRRVVAVFAAMRDKDIVAMAGALQAAGPDQVIVTAPEVQRAADPSHLAGLFDAARAVAPVAAALGQAREMAGPQGLVVVCGSLFLAGEVLALIGA